jgi:hypothetical protein
MEKVRPDEPFFIRYRIISLFLLNFRRFYLEAYSLNSRIETVGNYSFLYLNDAFSSLTLDSSSERSSISLVFKLSSFRK